MFFENENIQWVLRKRKNSDNFEYFMVCLVEIFYIQLVDYMYELMCKPFIGQHLHISWVWGQYKIVVRSIFKLEFCRHINR